MAKFYCPWCKINFGQADRTKKAICPICKKGRSDGLNQINANNLQCIICGCIFSIFLKTNGTCPNACDNL